MKYTAKQIDKMAIEELESLTYMLTAEQLIIWTGMGYDGATFVKLIKQRYEIKWRIIKRRHIRIC